MICPKCASDTRVVDSRPAEDGAIIARRRACMTCGHRFGTQESTFDVVAHRARGRRTKAAWLQRTPREVRLGAQRGYDATYKVRSAAREEAAATGRPVADVLRQWGASPPS
ncbi:hypothetical protein [Methylobacterium soli]|uniref:Transcriptional repressor NrdR-like N-terminal domain-containing protein n=1 Tax=Methylobacterium soli TaxID=553447 RepID=A0A6L3SV10_9HYPH|nr:hypothetical protein F6X53_22625 [Methylobacterium soli]GJE43496.1 Transcriptional repressor NrdR [Methylobacterium soli]